MTAVALDISPTVVTIVKCVRRIVILHVKGSTHLQIAHELNKRLYLYWENSRCFIHFQKQI